MKVYQRLFLFEFRKNLLQFEGQTKGKLGTSEARSAVDSVVSEHLTYFLEENPDISHLLDSKSQLKHIKHVKQHEKHVKMQETVKNEKS